MNLKTWSVSPLVRPEANGHDANLPLTISLLSGQLCTLDTLEDHRLAQGALCRD